jgi:hypothetical protein
MIPVFYPKQQSDIARKEDRLPAILYYWCCPLVLVLTQIVVRRDDIQDSRRPTSSHQGIHKIEELRA